MFFTGMIFSTDVNLVYVFVVIIGIGRCFWSLLVPLVMADLCPDNFTSVMGICFLFMGIINIGIGPIIGAIRDYTDSYIITFVFLIAINPICVIAWSMQLICHGRRKRNVKNKTNET
ncbi:unnamed protein product [Diatraea saccharalis]|uniref:Uncharacterized protein n=1 Tax=Diatraea saccharalis TaxID=40085 RepID=A0A9N9RGS5_9NEOP|nr:unnamed protein product [Diatraea saccharalis]